MTRRLWIALVRWGFHLLYNQFAWTYDVVSWLVSLGNWRRWQRAAIPYLPGERVLDLAFGTGNLLIDLAGAGYRPYGLDLSPYMVRIARRKLRRRGLDVPLCRGWAQALPFTDGAFDAVVSTFPAEFILQPSTLREVARVLRPGGRAVVVAEARLKGHGFLSRFIEWLYAITGQRGPRPQVDAYLQEIGLRATEEWPGNGPVRVIVAVK
ncbi:MAG: methyltransferase domain-containing protein [Anaerolineae bacterium]|jgi:ubiquinone/menaquinone biosynthesis C-methylase UbiE|nr:methyltransferase domain-containing protein [Anaerolineae bacterium]MDH7472487.1 methyltransferase domain-containing protein [Anaerolineae bacterium]